MYETHSKFMHNTLYVQFMVTIFAYRFYDVLITNEHKSVHVQKFTFIHRNSSVRRLISKIIFSHNISLFGNLDRNS